MNKRIVIIWGVLVVITVISAMFSNIEGAAKGLIILVFAGLKFMGVSFLFMELTKAHLFWKVLLIVFLILFLLSISVLL